MTIRILEKDARLLRARVRGSLGPYLTLRFAILVLAGMTAAFFSLRELLRASGDLAGAGALGAVALVLTSIAAAIGYELVVGQPVRADRDALHAIGGRVAVGELDRFEIAGQGPRVDVRAVRRDSRRVDVALGVDAVDARALVELIESVLEPAR